MATTRKINENSWQITIANGRDINGKQIRIYETYHPKETTPAAQKKEVKLYAMELEKRVKNGNYFEGEKTTFYNVALKWRDSVEYTNLTIGQQEQYMKELENKVFEKLGNIYISLIKTAQLQTLFDNETKQGLAPNTVKRTFTAINSVMRYAYRMEIIKNNPLDRCKLPTTKKQDDEIHYFDQEQAKRFLHEVLTMKYPFVYKEHNSKNGKTGKEQKINEYTAYKQIPLQFQLFFTLAIIGGFRKSELLALTWKDIDYENQVIHVRHATGRCSKGQYIKDTKTESGKRDVSMPQYCFDLLKQWHDEEKRLSVEMGTAWQGKHGQMFDNTFIFIQTTGKQMDTSTPYHKFKTIIKNYNKLVDDTKKIPELRLHDLRHTAATLMIASGIDIVTVSKRLGHRDPSITMKVYAHALESKDKEASNQLEKLFDL